MKLTVESKQIVLPVDAVINIERSTPLLNDDTGSYSFPFPVPTLPNQQNLNWPGKLQRTGDIVTQKFILEDSGIQVFRGEVGYDEITAQEIGLILQSGFTEFTKKMEGKKLADINYGSESWPVTSSSVWDTGLMASKLAEWDTANVTDNGKYVMAPFFCKMSYAPGYLLPVNYHAYGTDNIARLRMTLVANTDLYHTFCFEFRLAFIFRKIFESAGYTIAVDNLALSEFNKAIFYGNMITIQGQHLSGIYTISPVMNTIEYAKMMPDMLVLDFINLVKGLFCIMYEIDELKKEVRIKFKKDVFLPENLDPMKITELAGWIHKEERAFKGYTLRYGEQDDPLDTYTDWPNIIYIQNPLPEPTVDGQILQSACERTYLTTPNSEEVLEWKEVGRLRECKAGEGENVVELNIKVPAQLMLEDSPNPPVIYNPWGDYYGEPPDYFNTEQPIFPNLMRISNDTITMMNGLYISLYHGRKTFGTIIYPYTSFDRYSRDGSIDTGMSLKPTYLYNTVYSEFLNWQTYRARAFTKYIELSLLQLILLQWGKRYSINGIAVILNIIRYDLPYRGKVEIEGFTA